MKARWLVAVGLLAGCDDPTIISHVERRGDLGRTTLWTMQDTRGVPVEVHGQPFARYSPDETIDALRPPSRTSQDVRFYRLPADIAGPTFHGRRIVLHFNSEGAPHTPHDCRLRGRVRTRGPAGEGYTVNVSFCSGERWLGQAYLRAPSTRDGDIESFANAMRQVFYQILVAPE